MCLCTFRVQELMSGEQRETGRIPRTMECHLTSDLCDSCVPGDTVAVTAIVRVANEGKDVAKTHMLQLDWLVMFAVGLNVFFDTATPRGNKDQCMFLIYLEAVSVSNNKGTLLPSVCFILHLALFAAKAIHLFLSEAAKRYAIFRPAAEVWSGVNWVWHRR